MIDKLKLGCIVQVQSTGNYGVLVDLQYVHNRYQLRNLSRWQYDISNLEVVSADVLIEQLEQTQAERKN